MVVRLKVKPVVSNVEHKIVVGVPFHEVDIVGAHRVLPMSMVADEAGRGAKGQEKEKERCRCQADDRARQSRSHHVALSGVHTAARNMT